MTQPVIVGLTGGIGSGKSTAAKMFQDLGASFVDADDVAREVVQPGEQCLDAIAKHFGSSILHEDGSLNRAALREIVFTNPDERIWLEELTHPIIRERLLSHLKQAQGPYVLLVHPLLFEKQQDSLCAYTIALSVPRAIQIERVMQRDHNTLKQVERILATQLTDDERTQKANFILKNTSNNKDLSGRVIMLHKRLLEILVK